MFARLMPRPGRFFDLFNEHAEHIVLASRELAALMASRDDLERPHLQHRSARIGARRYASRRGP